MQGTLGPLQHSAAVRCSFEPRGFSTQWATTGAPEAHCGKEWWARQGKEPPTKPGVGRTKDDGAVTVQPKAPGTPCRHARHPRQP